MIFSPSFSVLFFGNPILFWCWMSCSRLPFIFLLLHFQALCLLALISKMFPQLDLPVLELIVFISINMPLKALSEPLNVFYWYPVFVSVQGCSCLFLSLWRHFLKNSLHGVCVFQVAFILFVLVFLVHVQGFPQIRGIP